MHSLYPLSFFLNLLLVYLAFRLRPYSASNTPGPFYIYCISESLSYPFSYCAHRRYQPLRAYVSSFFCLYFLCITSLRFECVSIGFFFLVYTPFYSVFLFFALEAYLFSLLNSVFSVFCFLLGIYIIYGGWVYSGHSIELSLYITMFPPCLLSAILLRRFDAT